jgi:hypothetical protein
VASVVALFAGTLDSLGPRPVPRYLLLLSQRVLQTFWADPPACAVGEPRKKYLGEHSFPLIMQNIHRYFLYLAAFSSHAFL